MSAFGNYEKDEIYENIKNFIANKKKEQPDIKPSQVIEEVMEVIAYGIKNGLYEIENS